MILNFKNNEIILEDWENSLTPVAKSQLSFWAFHIENSKYIAIANKQLFLKVLLFFKKENIKYELSKSAHKYSREIKYTNLNFENLKLLANKFKNGSIDHILFEEFRDFISSNIKRSLKIHQIKAAYHLYILGNAANFSVPGSGKTSVVLAVYEKLKQEQKVNVLFVVGPPSSFGPWKSEFQETLGRNVNPITLAGGNKKERKKLYYGNSTSELYLTTYQTLLSDKKEVAYFLSQKRINAFFVVDEAHYIKQIKGNWAKAILQQSEKALFRCVLTGTPMPKSYTDIFNLFDFLWPTQHPISSNDKTLIKYYEERNETSSAKNILDKNIGALFYRVRKSDLRLKAQNFLTPYTIEMEKHEKAIYDAIFRRIKDYSKNEYFKNIEFINKIGRGRIIRLRQSISYAKLLNTTIDDYKETLFEDLDDLQYIIRNYDSLETPGKLTQLLNLISEFQRLDLKVVIWSNFIGTIKLIEKRIKEKGFYCKIIYGNTPIEGRTLKEEETREKIRDEFVSPTSGLNILIANPAACAESISLHKTCHNAVYYDLTYNCAQYLQSLDRIHRVGGSENIEANYHFLQYKNTIDMDIKENIDKKAKKMFDVIEQDYDIYSLSLPETDGDAEAYTKYLKNEIN